MPALTSRVSLCANIAAEEDDDDDEKGEEEELNPSPSQRGKDDEVQEEPEDLLFSALATIFPDDAPNLHGDSHSSIVYTSPHLPHPLRLRLADPSDDEDRKLFSHYLWNAGLLLAELLEAAALRRRWDDGGRSVAATGDDDEGNERKQTTTTRREQLFDVRGLTVLEMGSGTGLPSIMAGLVGARTVVATDYPSETILDALRRNLARNLVGSRRPHGVTGQCASFEVHGHAWGDLASRTCSSSFPESHRHSLDRILIADCLWMPWQHEPLLRSVTYFLSLDPSARCLCVGACHTGWAVVARFFERQRLRSMGLRVEEIWERDVDGREREWEEGERREEEEELGMRKRWCVVAVLRRLEGWTGL